MAGGWGHIVADGEHGDNRYIGCELLENGGDFTEAVEELYGMVMFLTGGEPNAIEEARAHARVTREASDISRQ